jgi:hypothetical protein
MATTKRKAPPARVRYPGGRPMGAAPPAERKQVTPGQVARAPGQAATTITQRETRYGAKHMLTAELLIGVGIVAMRAIADYKPKADGTLTGQVGHPKGQYGPLPILAGLVVTFFLLSFLAASGGTKAKLAVIAGGIVDLGLLMNSTAEFQKVGATFSTFGTAKVPPGDWQTTDSGAAEWGTPIQGAPPGSGGLVPGFGGGQAPANPQGPNPKPKHGKCPAGYTLAKGKCFPNVQQQITPF